MIIVSYIAPLPTTPTLWPPRSTLSWTEYPLGTAESDVLVAGLGVPGVAFWLRAMPVVITRTATPMPWTTRRIVAKVGKNKPDFFI